MNQLPARPQAVQMIEMVRTNADIPGLIRTLAECYQLSVTVERDIKAIETRYALEESESQRRHEVVMGALEKGFNDRATFMAQMDASAKELIAKGHIEVAQAVLMRMMDIQSNSIIGEAMGTAPRRS